MLSAQVPDMEMLTHLPVFFDGLFHMLADPNKEIRQQTYSVLSEFLREIREVETIKYAPAVQVHGTRLGHARAACGPLPLTPHTRRRCRCSCSTRARRTSSRG